MRFEEGIMTAKFNKVADRFGKIPLILSLSTHYFRESSCHEN